MTRLTPQQAIETAKAAGYKLYGGCFINRYAKRMCAVGTYVLYKTGNIDAAANVIDRAQVQHDNQSGWVDFRTTAEFVAGELGESEAYVKGLNDGFERMHPLDKYRGVPEYAEGRADGAAILEECGK